jgi:hypothetical protein
MTPFDARHKDLPARSKAALAVRFQSEVGRCSNPIELYQSYSVVRPSALVVSSRFLAHELLKKGEKGPRQDVL